jgi:hypothetical protein
MNAAAEKFIGELRAWPEFAGAAADPAYGNLLPKLERTFAILEATAARDPDVAMVLAAVLVICNSRAPIRERCFDLAGAMSAARAMN